MNDLVTTFQNRFGDWAEALLQHLQISLLSLLIAILISVPLAVWLFNRKKASEAILQIDRDIPDYPLPRTAGTAYPRYRDRHSTRSDGTCRLCAIPYRPEHYYRPAGDRP